jgi:hypothetical protein
VRRLRAPFLFLIARGGEARPEQPASGFFVSSANTSPLDYPKAQFYFLIGARRKGCAMFIIEWLGPRGADGPEILDHAVCATSDLTAVIWLAKCLLKRPAEFPDGRTIAVRVVNEEGVQQWLGIAPNAELADVMPARKLAS